MAGLLDFLGMQGGLGGGLLGGIGNGVNGLQEALGGRDAMIMMGLGLAGGSTAAEGFKNAAMMYPQGVTMGRTRQASEEFAKGLQGMFGSGMQPGMGGPPPMAAPQAGVPTYNQRLTQVESGGDASARNPNSSATGPAQFTNSTWLENFDKTFPAQAGMAPDAKLALRTNQQYVTPVLNTFTQGNEAALTKAGIPLTDMTRYAAHFFGADDATKVLKADPNVPLSNLVQPASIKANPFLANMTAGQAQEWVAGKMGGGAPQAPGIPTNPLQSPGAVNPALFMKAIGNPNLPEGQRKIGELLFTNWLDQSKMTGDQKEYLWSKAQGYQGSFADYQKELKASGATNVTVNTAGEKSFDQKLGTGQADYFLETQKAGRDSLGAVANLSVMRKLIDNPDFYSGTGGQTVTAVKRALVSAGIKDAQGAAPNELFTKLSNKVLLDAAGGTLGTGFSNADREFMANTNANITNTPEGNRAIIDMAVKVEERKQQVAQMARDYAKSHGGRLDTGFDEQLSKWAQVNPLFPQQMMQGQRQQPQVQEGATATNKQTGQKIEFRGGQWRPVAAGPTL